MRPRVHVVAGAAVVVGLLMPTSASAAGERLSESARPETMRESATQAPTASSRARPRLLTALVPVTAAAARTPSKGKAERFLQKRFGTKHVDGVKVIGADATCVRPRSTRRSRSTRCVIRIQRADSSVCVDNRVIVKYRGRRSNRMVVRGFNPECRDIPAPPPEIPSDAAPPAFPDGPPPVTGGPPPTGSPERPGAVASRSGDRSLRATTRALTGLKYCTPWEIDPWYGMYYVYACVYELSAYEQLQKPGVFFQADVYYYYGDASRGAYWFSFPVGHVSSGDFR